MGSSILCNPNNPTSVLTTRSDMAWLVENLPANTYLLVDEAYIHYATSPDAITAIPYVKAGKNVIVSRTFSKVYGMAGLRVGFVAARPDLISRMEPFRNNVISIVSVRAVLAALDLGSGSDRGTPRENCATRDELCSWLTERKINFIPPQANFIVVETGQDARLMQAKMLAKGIAVGRPFEHLEKMMRVTIGTDAEMAKFRVKLTKDEHVKRTAVVNWPLMIQVTEEQVREILSMDECVRIMRQTFRRCGRGLLPISRAGAFIWTTARPCTAWAASTANILARNFILQIPSMARIFSSFLFDSETGVPLAQFEANYLGQIRTGAASGYATDLLAAPGPRHWRDR